MKHNGFSGTNSPRTFKIRDQVLGHKDPVSFWVFSWALEHQMILSFFFSWRLLGPYSPLEPVPPSESVLSLSLKLKQLILDTS